MLLKMDADTIAFLSLITSTVGVVVGLISAVAAIFAAFYSKKAATKDNPAQVEQNTQHVEHFRNKILSIDTAIHPPQKQEDSPAQAQQKPSQAQAERKAVPEQQETFIAQAQVEVSPAQVEQKVSQAQLQRIPISVEGEAMGEVPLELFLTVQDSSTRVRRVERLSEAGKNLGSSPCKATDSALVFKSILAPEKVRQWWDAGESASEGETRGVLRVYLLLDESGREVHRDMPVSIVEGLRSVGIATLVVWTIKGSI
jgi:type IV secretory pathway VirB10-like protein